MIALTTSQGSAVLPIGVSSSRPP